MCLSSPHTTRDREELKPLQLDSQGEVRLRLDYVSPRNNEIHQVWDLAVI